MIKVYFGPYKHSPAPELDLDERRLWFTDFGLLKGYDKDFWTNNVMVLDMFDASQVYLYYGRWRLLTELIDELFTERHVKQKVTRLPTGRKAMSCQLLLYIRQLEEQDNPPQTS